MSINFTHPHRSLTAEERQAHRITRWVYAGGERIRRESTMRGTWGHDATCSCGWDSRTGGAVESYVEARVNDHKLDVQLNRKETAR